MKHFNHLIMTMQEKLYLWIAQLGILRWAVTAALCCSIILLWFFIIALPLNHKKNNLLTLLAQSQQSTQQQADTEQQLDAYNQEIAYLTHNNKMFDSIIAHASPHSADWISTLMQYLQKNLTLTSYEPCQTTHNNPWYQLHSASFTCIGEYHDLHTVIVAMHDHFPQSLCTIKSLVRNDDTKIQAILEVKTIIATMENNNAAHTHTDHSNDA